MTHCSVTGIAPRTCFGRDVLCRRCFISSNDVNLSQPLSIVFGIIRDNVNGQSLSLIKLRFDVQSHLVDYSEKFIWLSSRDER